MESHLQYPKIRWPIDLRLEKLVDQEVLLLNCPLGIASEPLGLNPAVAPILSCFDGESSIEQIVERFSSFGVTAELIEELVSLLDQKLFLAGSSYELARRTALQEFQAATTRPAVLAGRGYSLEASALAAEIDGYLSSRSTVVEPQDRTLLAAIVPHIDYRRGGACYGAAYNYLENVDCDLYVLLGTAHQFSHQHFHFTKKDFECPLGTLKCDGELVSAITQQHGETRSFADEFLHKNEHSLELQLPFLTRLKKNPQILPILIGAWADLYAVGKDPFAFDEFASFITVVAEQISLRMKAGQKICFIASVDLAHLGRAFGDQGSLTSAFLEEVKGRDHELLDAVMRCDPQALRQHVISDQDSRRICGFPTIFTLLSLLKCLNLSSQGRLYQYQQAVNYETDCAVTFYGMGLYGER